jgi:proteasome accessory factor C
MTDLHERLRKLLFLVPFVVRHQGVSLHELAERLKMSESELQREIDFLLMVGRPPFMPNDMLDIYYEGGKVFVDLHQSLREPPQLTVFEALALAVSAQILAKSQEMGEAVESINNAVEKIVTLLPTETQKVFEQLSSRFLVLPSADALPFLTLLKQAGEQRQEVELTYFTASRNTKTIRKVYPHGVSYRSGTWYLVAYCTQREENRVFRVSRVDNARLTGQHFEKQAEFDVSTFVEKTLTIPDRGSREIVVRFSPVIARWIRERWSQQYLTDEPDGSLIARMYDVSDEYVMSYVASFGGDAVIESPPDLAEKIKCQAQLALQRYK